MQCAEEGQESVAFDYHSTGARKWEAAAPQAHRDKSYAEAQQRGEHRQAAHVDEHGGEDDVGLVRERVDAAEVGIGPGTVGEDPPGGDIGQCNAQQGHPAGDVGDKEARSRSLAWRLGPVVLLG